MSKRRRVDVQGERKSDAPRGNRMTTRLKERKRPAEEESPNPRSKPRIAQEQKECAPMSDREKRARAAERRAKGTPHVATEASKQATTDDFDARVEKFRQRLHKETKHVEERRKRARAYEERIKHQRAIDNLRDLLGGMTIGNPPKTKHDNTPLRF